MTKKDSEKQLDKTAEVPICFVIMPIADAPGYEAGHFGRVYEHLLKPAIVAAGYRPIRADDTNKTDYIVVGIIQKIVESEMVICDLSARNPNVLYELGIRHAFGKPVTLIKDRKTEKLFDIQGLRYQDYDDSLRVDSVNKEILKITAAILETAKAEDKDNNSVVKLAGLHVANVPEKKEISQDTQLILSAIGDLTDRVGFLETSRRFAMTSEVIVVKGRKIKMGATVTDLTTGNVGKFARYNVLSGKFGIEFDGRVKSYSADEWENFIIHEDF